MLGFVNPRFLLKRDIAAVNMIELHYYQLLLIVYAGSRVDLGFVHMVYPSNS